MLFTGSKYSVPSQSYKIFKFWIYRVFPEMDIFGISKFIFSYSFWDKCLKLGTYVPGAKTKLLIEPIFYLGLRREKCRILKFEIWNFWQSEYFQNWIFSLLRYTSKIGSIKSFVLAPINADYWADYSNL